MKTGVGQVILILRLLFVLFGLVASTAVANASPVAAPSFSPAAGTYTSAQAVTMTSTTRGATIRYTTDGSTPTETTGLLYFGAVSVSGTTTLNALAYKAGYTDSTVTSGLYTIPQVAAPTFSPGGGFYNSAQTVTITTTTSGATIRYTMDGSTPTETIGAVYSSPVNIGATTVLKAIAYGSGFSDSPVTGGLYTISWPAPPSLNVLYNFNAANKGAANPCAGLVQGSDGNFYGTTRDGGIANSGTVFKITPAGALTTLALFNGANGSNILTGLMQGSDGNFYGTTTYGGDYSYGTVFEMTPAGALTTLVLFDGTNGAWPYAGLVQGSDGNFYGTTTGGGSGDYGTVFKMTPAGVLTTLASFDGTNGSSPGGNLVQGSDGNFYGTVPLGGSDGYGFVYKITPDGVLTTLISFTDPTWAYPYAGLALGSDGNFYGTTDPEALEAGDGGNVNYGTVFKITPAGALTTLVSFDGENGANPYAGLVSGSDGNFYGTTKGGGSDYSGSIFKITPAGALTTLASFDGVNGDDPSAGLVRGSDGNFYGTTYFGGIHDNGVVFQLIVPGDYYNGVLPVLTSQVGSGGVPGSQGLVSVLVTDSSGHPLANAPITLSVTTGASTISATTSPGSLTSVNVFTNSSGIASAYVTFSNFAMDTLVATAESGANTQSLSINIIPSPTNITGMQLWLKADAGVAADISTWADQSGNDNNATQANPSQRPTLVTNALNGWPVMHFDASQQQYLQLPNVMASATSPTGEATAGEIFMVVRSTGTTGSLGGWGGIYGSYYPYNGNIYDDFGTNVWTSLGQPAQDITQYQLYNISSSSSEWTQRFNGLVNYDRLVNTVSFRASPVLGTSNNIFLSGDIAEIIVYNQVLTQAQRDTVNTYLGSKYNLYTAPPVPASLTATPLSPGQVSLQWSVLPRGDHVSYLVERSTDGVSYIQVAAVRDSLSYIDTGLAPATTYTYRVRAQGYTGTSGYSNLASTITLLSKGGTDLPLIGMRLWLKADAGLSAGSGINLWADQSGNDNNATQTIASQQPTLVANGFNGRPVVHFDASKNQCFNLPNVMASTTSSTGEAGAGEIFVVVRSTGTLGSLGGWGGASGSYYPYNGNIYDDFGTNAWTSLGQPAQDITQFLLYNVSSSSSEWTQRFNGLVSYDRLVNTVSFRASPVLGTSNNAYLSGDIAEIIVYDHVLNDQERETVGFYLNSKYAFVPLADFDNYRDGNYDGLPDAVDRLLGIDPTNLDDDGEGYSNLQLILAGYDPLDPNSIPPPPLPPVPGNPPPTITLTAPANAVPLP
jgi:uncharacterized repeat protein (TIGR03803 family)